VLSYKNMRIRDYLLIKPLIDTNYIVIRAIRALSIYKKVLPTITESSRRYISDKIVGGFINVLSTSHVCPRGDIVR